LLSDHHNAEHSQLSILCTAGAMAGLAFAMLALTFVGGIALLVFILKWLAKLQTNNIYCNLQIIELTTNKLIA
jgi:hypothetical protein